nr:MAG TPA: hypothetical protein [Caudoviricetes sp.]
MGLKSCTDCGSSYSCSHPGTLESNISLTTPVVPVNTNSSLELFVTTSVND